MHIKGDKALKAMKSMQAEKQSESLMKQSVLSVQRKNNEESMSKI